MRFAASGVKPRPVTLQILGEANSHRYRFRYRPRFDAAEIHWPQKAQSSQNQFTDLDDRRPEINQQRMMVACCSQVTERLREMLVGKCFAGFQFHDETIFNEQICEIIAEDGPVFVPSNERALLNHAHTEFTQAVRQSIFINFFQMTMAKIDVQLEGDLPDLIT